MDSWQAMRSQSDAYGVGESQRGPDDDSFQK